jgi:hypothetical protein
VLDFVEEALDQMAFTVQVMVIVTRLFAVATRRNNRGSLMFKNKSQQIITVIATVSQEVGKAQAIQERLGLRDVMPLSASEPKPQGITQAIYTDVDFGAEATSAASQGLILLSTSFFDAPAAHGWARMTLLSSISGKVAEHLLPHASFTPAGKALIHAIPFTIRLWQQAPLCPATTDPQYCFDEAPTAAG